MEHHFLTETFSNPEGPIRPLYRNPHVRLPFDPKELVMFVHRDAPVSEEGTPLPPQLRVLPYHHRSADFGVSYVMHERIPSSDADHPEVDNVFCQIDLKGGGFLFPEGYESKKDRLPLGSFSGASEAALVSHSMETVARYNVLGLLDDHMATSVIQTAERLAAAGMRTEAIAGVYYLPSIRVEGKEVPIEEWKHRLETQFDSLIAEARARGDEAEASDLEYKKEDLDEEFNPVEAVRLMRSVFRWRDVVEARSETEQNEMLSEACKNLNLEAQELGQRAGFEVETAGGKQRWMNFITRWVGKNMGILHREGLIHTFLHMGNLTLAGEVVDLDSVQNVVSTKRIAGAKQQPFATKVGETGGKYAYIDPAIGRHRLPDSEFGLPKCLLKDLRDGCFSVRAFLREVRKFQDVDRAPLVKAMQEGYDEGFGNGEPFQAIGISRDRLCEVLNQLAERIIGRKEYYAPVPLDPA